MELIVTVMLERSTVLLKQEENALRKEKGFLRYQIFKLGELLRV